MSASPPPGAFAGLQHLLDEAVRQGVTPGACLAWGVLDGGPVRCLCAGATALPGLGPEVRPVTPATLYDLASLTKPLVTALAAMLLVDAGRLALDDPVGRFLPGWSTGRRSRVRLRHLLAHEAGLPWWEPYHLELRVPEGVPEGESRRSGEAGAGAAAPATHGERRRNALRDRLLALEPAQEPGQAAVYSDPGYLLLGLALEQAAGEPLAELVARRLGPAWGPELGFVDLEADTGPARCGVAWPRAGLLGEGRAVAATESCPWRGRVLWAEVHDENAHFLGGIAPHAGLFGSAGAVVRLGLALLGARAGRAGSPLGSAVVRACWEGGSRPDGATWALGWDTPTPGRSSAGRRVSPRAVGHLGFTGTSLWLDPERGAAVALLTNRVHPSRADERVKLLRPAVHDAVWELLDRT